MKPWFLSAFVVGILVAFDSSLGVVSENRMNLAQASQFLTEASDVSKAVDERAYAVSRQTSLTFLARSGSPEDVVADLKSKTSGIIPVYVDTTVKTGGNYNDWFEALAPYPNSRRYTPRFPKWSASNLLVFVAMPSDALTVTPEEGKTLLISPDYGLSALSDILSELSAFQIDAFQQINEERVASIDTYESYSSEWIDTGYCNTSRCDTVFETRYSGEPVLHTSCELPDVVPVTTGSIGHATWSVSYNASYRFEDQQNEDDYEWYGPIWDKTRSRSESSDVNYHCKDVSSVSAFCTSLKSEIKGSMIPYGKFEYTPQVDYVLSNVVTVGCSDRFGDIRDENGDVVGQYKSGVRYDQTVTNTYHVPGWDPGLSQTYVQEVSVTKPRGRSTLSIPVPLSVDSFSDVAPSLTHDYDYTCDAVSDPHYFGLGHYGIVGYTVHRKACDAIIPPRTLSYDIGAVLMEADFEYCP